MKKQKYIIASVALLLFGTIFVSSYLGSLERENNIKNSSASVLNSVLDFLGFGQCTPETIPEGSIVNIDDKNNTIDVTIPYGNYSSMCFAPSIQTLYSKAVVTPASGEAVDFTSPVTYTIKQDNFEKSYVVTVKTNPLVTTINTCEDLQNMRYGLSEKYNLAQNIDCGGINFKPIGSTSTPFTGSLEGNSYTISNLYINRPTEENVGLFGYTEGVNISNLEVVDVEIIGGVNSGSLVGSGSGDISYISVNGDLMATSGNSYMGGIAGNFSGSIKNTSFEGNVILNGDKVCSYHFSYPCSNSYVGGLVGNSEATIDSSYFSGNVKSDALYTGGLVGVSSANINNSYAKGVVKGGAYFGVDVPYKGTGYTGGLIGSWWGGLVSNSYFAGDVSFKSLWTSYYYTYCGGGLAGDGYGATFNNSFAVTNFSCEGACDGYNTEAGALGGCGRNITMKDSAVHYTGSYIQPFAYGNYTNQAINTSVAPNKEYFFGDPINLPMNTWDTNIWSFAAEEYPTLKTGPAPIALCITSDPTNPDCWSDESSPLVWSTIIETTGANNYDNGRSNQDVIRNNFELSNYPAFAYCEQLTEDGVPAGTWYLPSLGQLVSGYSTGLFANNNYWSSYEMLYDTTAAETLRTDEWSPGGTTPSVKDQGYFPVRCLRGLSPSVSLNASSTTVVAGDTAVLTWTPENSTSCTASGNDPYWNGSSLDATSGSHSWTTAPLTAGTYDYGISCTANSGSAATSIATVVSEEPITCSSFTYSPWSACTNSIQSRTVVTSSPAGCVGGEPVISQSCTIPIFNCQDLQNIDKDLSYNNYTLEKDIDCSDTKNWNGGKGFSPINKQYISLDGKGYKISNLYINRPTQDNVGLFGQINFVSIVNIGLVNVNITGGSSVGSFLGSAGGNTTSLTGSYSTGKVIGLGNTVGGLGGSIGDYNITKSYSAVDVSGVDYVGGLIGSAVNINGPSIESTYATGKVVGSGQKVGGLVGYSRGPIINSYSVGLVSSLGGGLIGSGYEGSVSNSFWDIQTSGRTISSKGIGKTTLEMKTPSTFVGWDTVNIWNIVNGSYPTFKNGSAPIVYPPTVTLNTSTSTVVEGNSATLTWNVTNANSCTATGETSYWAGSDLATSTGAHTWLTGALTAGAHTYGISCAGNGSTVTATVVVTATPVSTGGGATGGGSTGGGTMVPVSFDGGTGTESDPYQISDWKQLNSVRSKLSSYYILKSNLTTASVGYAGLGDNWTPIGNNSNVFTGSFNGNSKTISDLKINSSGTSYVGLFGYSTGDISYLGVNNISITNENHYVGAIAGQMGGGTITESYSTGNILGLSYVGGLVGKQSGGTISNSYSKANINSFIAYAGGLVGQQSNGYILDSYSTGKVLWHPGASNYGGLIGNQNPPSDKVENSYWDKQTSTQNVSADGVGKTTAEMKTSNTFSVWDKNIWNITNVDYPALVPYLDQSRASFTTSSNTGGKVSLSWVVANASSCTASGAWSGTPLTATNGSHTWTSGTLPSGDYTYNISCLGSRGEVNDSTIVNVSSGPVLSSADLNCKSLSMISPVTSSNEVNVNNNTVWKASSSCPTCTVNWSVTDTNNPNPIMTSGTNPWNKIFTTVGSKTVTAQFVSPSGTSGNTCTTTTTVVQTGGGTEI